MEAYSERTNTSYPSYQALVAAETSGWIATAVMTNISGKRVWTWSVGPFDTQAEAKRAQARVRTRVAKSGDTCIGVTVRPLWKET